MTAPDCNEAARLITGLVDGELGVEDVARVRDHIARCDDCAARHRMEARLKDFLCARAGDVRAAPDLGVRVRAALARVAEVEPAEAFRPAAAVPGRGPARTPAGGIFGGQTFGERVRSRWLPLSVLTAALVGMTGMWITLETRGAGGGASPFMEALAGVHYAATQAGIFQVRTQDPEELSAWLSDHVGHPVTVPALTELGLTPAGGRVVDIDGRHLPMALYRDYVGGRPDLTLVAAGHEVAFSPEGWHTAQEWGRRVHHARVRGEDMAVYDDGQTLWILVSTGGEDAMTLATRAVADAVSVVSADLEPAATIR